MSGARYVSCANDLEVDDEEYRRYMVPHSDNPVFPLEMLAVRYREFGTEPCWSEQLVVTT